VSCGSEAERWAPADRSLHRLLAQPAPCRPCAHAVCPIGHPCAVALHVPQVLQAVGELLADTDPHKEIECPAACAS
jgi:hypothetical protein